MIHLAEPNLTGNEKNYLAHCIDSTFVSSVGEYVTLLEEKTAQTAETDYGVAVSSGTSGLHMALLACGIQPGDLVCIPSFTFIATANAVRHCGADPWLMDVDSESWTLSCEILEKELQENVIEKNGRFYHKHMNHPIGAIMPVYTLGLPADMDNIRNIAKKYRLPVIADAAAAIGAKYKGVNLGKLADATVFSFNGNKTMTCGGGGSVVSNRKEIADMVRHLSTTARVGTDYTHDMVGYNNRMTNLQAAVGVAQLERLDEFIQKKRSIRSYYNKHLSDIPGIHFFPETSWAESSCWFSGIILPERFDVKKICLKLSDRGIEGRPFWKPVHLQQPYLHCAKSELYYTNNIWSRILTLPSSTGIRQAELDYVVTVVSDILSTQE